MQLRNAPDRWGPVSKLLHWTIVVLIGWLAWLGLTMVDMPTTPAKIDAYALHKSLGLTLLALVTLRLAWRLYAGAAHALSGTPRWQTRIAGITHAGMYVLMFVIPLSGWLFNSASGYPLQWFRQFNLPALAGQDAMLAQSARLVHEVGVWLLLALVAMHAGAALYHHFVQRDATLRRMLPSIFRKRPRTPAPRRRMEH
ncbi:cytochrome b [Luteimonas yindakuii]|uniref:Cytochrome b n=1 Tax=Luteimonas yindakuii TaxID=2565782 RepID=A0A4Z1R5A3_9GAMM|nr:cytochrome b [Luteimonas yindakuii]TKS54630.1 cytochrome b [Luteimonas yindakuii]